MRLGIGSYSLAWNIQNGLDHFGLLEVARQLGVQAVQYCDNLPLEALSQSDLDQLERMSGGITLEPGTRGIDMDRLAYLGNLAQRFGCGFVRIVIDRSGDEPTVDEAVDRLAQWRRKVSGDTVLAIENHDRFPARVFAEMIEELGPDRYGICLDTANSLGCLEGTEYVVNTLAPYTVNLHVKDIRIRRLWHNMGFEVTGTPAGEGDLDIPWIVSQVPQAESAIIEIWASEDNAYVEERRMLDASVPFMERIIGSRPEQAPSRGH